MNEIRRPILKPFDKASFEIIEDYEVTLSNGEKIAIPKGYKTNGADVPRILWSIFPPNSPEYLSAVIVHDYLCDLEQYKKADMALKDMMKRLKVAKWKVYAFYYGCRTYHKIRYGV